MPRNAAIDAAIQRLNTERDDLDRRLRILSRVPPESNFDVGDTISWQFGPDDHRVAIKLNETSWHATHGIGVVTFDFIVRTHLTNSATSNVRALEKTCEFFYDDPDELPFQVTADGGWFTITDTRTGQKWELDNAEWVEVE